MKIEIRTEVYTTGNIYTICLLATGLCTVLTQVSEHFPGDESSLGWAVASEYFLKCYI